MRRLHGAFTALALAVLAGPAAAAEITRVASSGEPGNPFDIDISIRWERFNERATITRETAPAARRAARIVDGDELRFVRTRNAIVPRVGGRPLAGPRAPLRAALRARRRPHAGASASSTATPSGGVPPGLDRARTPSTRRGPAVRCAGPARSSRSRRRRPSTTAAARATSRRGSPGASSTTGRTTRSRSGSSGWTSPSRPRPPTSRRRTAASPTGRRRTTSPRSPGRSARRSGSGTSTPSSPAGWATSIRT